MRSALGFIIKEQTDHVTDCFLTSNANIVPLTATPRVFLAAVDSDQNGMRMRSGNANGLQKKNEEIEKDLVTWGLLLLFGITKCQ